ncbi:PepSY-associated TM helix domain-containing protein [Pedobacter sp. PWIIR3]
MTTTTSKRTLKWATHQKRWFGKWHLYLGIFAGLILSVVGLTGSILVFQDEIDQCLNKELFETTKGQHHADFAEITDLIKKNYPKLKYDYILLSSYSPSATYWLHVEKTEQDIYINPYTGKICGKRLHESGFIGTVTMIHRTLLIPAIGRYVVGLSALILLILTISGVRLWLPKKWKQLRAAMGVKFSGSFKRKNYDWHKAIGIYTSPMVALMALTGFSISFSVLVIPLLLMLSGLSPNHVQQIFYAKSTYVKDAKPLSVKQVTDIAARLMPDAKVGFIGFPKDSVDHYSLNMIGPELPKLGSRELISLDQYSGKVLVSSRDFPQSGRAYLSWLTPIHYGTFGGLTTQLLALIGGLAPISMLITGVIIWFPRWRRKKEPAKVQTPVADPGFLEHFKRGSKFALIMVGVTMALGVLYGALVGIVAQPAVFGMALSTIIVLINFGVALAVWLFNAIFLMPFKKGSKMLNKYFALSLSFSIVYLIIYNIFLNSGLKLF